MGTLVDMEASQLEKMVKIQKHRRAYFITWCLYFMSILAVIALIIDVRTESFPIWLIYGCVICVVIIVLSAIYIPFQLELSKKKIDKRILTIEKKDKNTFYGFATSMLEESKMRAVHEEYMLFTTKSCLFVDKDFYDKVNEGEQLDIFSSVKTRQIIELKTSQYSTLDITIYCW